MSASLEIALRNRQIVVARERGTPRKAIAKSLNVPVTTIDTVLYKRPSDERNERNAKIVAMRAAGVSRAEISETLRVGLSRIDKVVRMHNRAEQPPEPPKPKAQPAFDPDMRIRKCLQCGKEIRVHKRFFMCDCCRRAT